MIIRFLATTLPALGMLLAMPSAGAQALTRTGYGVVHFGERLSVAQAHMHAVAMPVDDNAQCGYVKFVKYPGILFMVENGIVTRAESRHWIRNAAGVKFGETVEQVRRKHPDIVVTPHKYDDDGNYLRYPTADGKFAIIFEASKGKVNLVRAGVRPSVDYVEGCL
jgi:hypothetical protein